MNRKFKIILDIDDVSANTTSRVIELANIRHGTNFTKDDVFSWHLDDVFPGYNLCSIFDEPGFFYNLEPYDGAIYYTKKLVEDGFDIIVTTASPQSGFECKSKWLQKYFPHIPEKNLILAWRKDCVRGDIMLDDALHNIESSICTHPVIFNQPWNTKNNTNTLRVYSWEEFYNLAHKLRKCKEQSST